MRNQLLPLSVLFLLLLALPVLADYTNYGQQGNTDGGAYNVQGTGSTVVTTLPLSTTGTLTEILVFDATGDITPEVFFPAANGILQVRQGDDPANIISTFSTGTLASQPVACDVDNDGFLEYVGIFDDTTTNTTRLAAFDLSSTGGITAGTVRVLPFGSTNIHTVLRCGAFFTLEGDTANHIMFVNTAKTLHLLKKAGTNFTGTITDVSPAGFPSAMTAEAASTYKGVLRGTSDLVFSRQADPAGKYLVAFTAGDTLYVYFSDGTSLANEFTLELGGYNGTDDKYYQLMGDVFLNGQQGLSSIVLLAGGDNHLGNDATQEIPVIFFQLTGGFSGSLNVVGVRIEDHAMYLGGFSGAGITVPNIVKADFDGDLRDDIVLVSHITSAIGTGISTEDICPTIHVIDGELLNTTLTVKDLTASCHNAVMTLNVSTGARSRSFVADVIGFDDLVLVGGANETLLVLPRSANYSYDSGVNVNNLNFTTGGDSMDLWTPVLADVNNDGGLDYFFSTPGLTTVLISALVTPTQRDFPFTVEFQQGGSSGLTTTHKITAGFEPFDGRTYNYALVCDLSSTVLFNEQFKTDYNFTSRNVTVGGGVGDPEAFLTFNSLTLSLGGNVTALNLFKTGQTEGRGILETTLDFSTTGNITVDLIALTQDSKITEYLRVNKTADTILVYKIVGGDAPLLLANQSGFSSANTVVSVLNKEIFNTSLQRSYFTGTIMVNGVAMGAFDTAAYPGVGIRDVQVYSDAFSTLAVHRLGLDKTTDTEPSFLQFQNAFSTVVNGQTVGLNASASQFTGDGFFVVPGVNDFFFGQCVYPGSGTFTQRHYLAPPDTSDDYSNFVEKTVTVIGVGSSPTEDGEVGEVIDDPLIDTFETGVLEPAGLDSFLGRLLIALVVIGAVTYAGFLVHWLLGVLGGVVGLVFFSIIGYVPFWVILLLVILAAGIISYTIKMLFGESGG